MPSLLKYTDIDNKNIITVNSGEFLLIEGEIGECFYILLEGAIKVLRGKTEVAVINQRGAVVGELAIITGLPHSASCQAMGAVKVLKLVADTQFMENNPKLLMALARDMAAKLNRSTITLSELAIRDNTTNNEINLLSETFNSVLNEVSELVDLTDDYYQAGMRLLITNNLGKPDQLKSILGLQRHDFCVCAFMGSKPGSIEGLQDIVRRLPESLSEISTICELSLKLISGGGNWQGITPDNNTGLMGQWAYGATRSTESAYFVTMLNLLKQEGIPFADGAALCLNQDDTQNRLGERTDGLVCLGDMFIVFPGGLGTLSELATIFTSADVNDHFGDKKIIIFDPLLTNNNGPGQITYWHDEIQGINKMNRVGFISNSMADKINEHCLIYQPCSTLSVHEVVDEFISMIIAIRARFYEKLSMPDRTVTNSGLLDKYCKALSPSSIVIRPFDKHIYQGDSWGSLFQKIICK